MTRMMFMTWYGRRRWESEAHPHESPSVMTWPMIILAIGSVGAGAFLIINDRLQDFLAPVVGQPPTSEGVFTTSGIVALVFALAGVGLAWLIYGRVPVSSEAPRGSLLTVAARKDLYGDAFNESVLMRPGQWLTRLSVYFDNRGVDGLVNTLAAAVGGSSGRLRKLQTGFVRSYALSMFFGAAVLVALLLVVRL
jgi:NADH-quinone oxidoreductase subunit L